MRLLILCLAALLYGCVSPGRGLQSADGIVSRTAFNAPAPKDNPTTPSKVELGFRLWFEPRLSSNDQMSCATCHQHTKGFSNGERTAVGVTGARGARNVPTIYAAAFREHQFWDGRAQSLEEQALGPIQNPVEMNASLDEVVTKLKAVPYYRHKFREAFGTEVSAGGIAKAIASFERALSVGPSPYDRFLAGDATALSPQQQRGEELFFANKTSCRACHRGPDLTTGFFFNLGVGPQSPEGDPGRFAVTGHERDRGAFKTPTLRNVAQTAPYMHDGSLATLEEVVEFYDRGGGEAPNLAKVLRPLRLSAEEKADLVAFLHALTGPDNLSDIAKRPGVRLPGERLDHLPADLRP